MPGMVLPENLQLLAHGRHLGQIPSGLVICHGHAVTVTPRPACSGSKCNKWEDVLLFGLVTSSAKPLPSCPRMRSKQHKINNVENKQIQTPIQQIYRYCNKCANCKVKHRSLPCAISGIPNFGPCTCSI